MPHPCFSRRPLALLLFILTTPSVVQAQTNVFPTTGNVGIGTTSPRSRLDLSSSMGAGKGARLGDYLEINEREFINNALTIGWNAHIAADDGTFAPTYAPGTGMVLTMAAGGISDLDFYGKNWGGSDTPQTLDSFTHVMRLSTSGNVGIGTTSPGGKLQILSPDVGSARTYSTANGFGLIFDQYYSAVAEPGGSFVRTADIVASTGDISSSQIRFLTKPANSNPAVTMLLSGNGNVGIGTTSPTHKLAVNGTVRAKEVIVDTGWADYVFADDYRLAPLSEVEAHIKAHRTLPGVPSEATIAKEGVSVGEMQAKMMAKIEELTLHVIRQEKENSAQSARLAALETENDKLRRQLSKASLNQ